jgi:hypothetical protein
MYKQLLNVIFKMLSQQLQAASTLGLLQMGQIICHVRVFSESNVD